MNKILICRILGNDLINLKNKNDIYIKLEYILNQDLNIDFDYLFVINKIYYIDIKNKIIDILKKHNAKYIDIPFNLNEFLNLKNINYSNEELLKINKCKITTELYEHNLFLINKNKCRNICINYGKENKYNWTFVCEINNIFNKIQLDDIINKIKEIFLKDLKINYLIIPEKTITQFNINLNVLMIDINKLKLEDEPIIGFNINSTFFFNENIPYGLNDKTELLKALNVDKYVNKNLNFYNLHIKIEIYIKMKIL